MARLTGLEPATPGVTGRYSNQLSYNRPLLAFEDKAPSGVEGVLGCAPDPVKRPIHVRPTNLWRGSLCPSWSA